MVQAGLIPSKGLIEMTKKATNGWTTRLAALVAIVGLLAVGLLAVVSPADAHGGCASSRFCGIEHNNYLGGLRQENADDRTWVDDGFNDRASSLSNHESNDVRVYEHIGFVGKFWCVKANTSWSALAGFNDKASSVDYDFGGCGAGGLHG